MEREGLRLGDALQAERQVAPLAPPTPGHREGPCGRRARPVFDEAMSLDLSPRIETALRDAHPYPDGRWLFLGVESDEEVVDLQRLIALKSPPPRRRRAG